MPRLGGLLQRLLSPHGAFVASLVAAGLLLYFSVVQGDRPVPKPAMAVSCDRSCLEHHMDAVLEAMRVHDPLKLPFAAGFRYVENNQLLQAGDGSWRTIQAFGGYRHYFADPESGNAAVITTMRENDEDGLFTLRIRVADGRLLEAESVITHDAEAAARYTRLGKPAAEWLETVPEADRLSRDELIEVANKYYGALENNDGKGDYSFFADDCDRVEQGQQATNTTPRLYGHSGDRDFVTLDCRAQFETGFLGFITRIRDRRFDVIDVERGAVFAIAALDHNDKYHGIPLTDGGEFKLPAYFSVPRTLQVAEGFRIRDGRIRDIETTLNEFPYGMPVGIGSTFDPSREVPYGRPVDPQRSCDAACLQAMAEQLLRAMAAHDPRRAPLADTALYTENDQRIEFYDGLWGTITEIGSWRLRVIEPARHEITVLARVTESDIAGLLALRIRANGDRIVDIEASIVREERAGSESMYRVRPLVEAAPALLRDDPALNEPVAPSRRSDVTELLSQVDRYFDAIQRGQGGAVRIAKDCLHRENGVTLSNNPDPGFMPFSLGCAAQLDGGYTGYVSRVRDRRILTVDETRGLVVAMAYYDIPGTVRSVGNHLGRGVALPARLGRPHTLALWQVFRIQDGAIHHIEGLARVMPYGARPYPRN